MANAGQQWDKAKRAVQALDVAQRRSLVRWVVESRTKELDPHTPAQADLLEDLDRALRHLGRLLVEDLAALEQQVDANRSARFGRFQERAAQAHAARGAWAREALERLSTIDPDLAARGRELWGSGLQQQRKTA